MVFEENSCAISGEIESLRFQLDDKVKQLHYWKMKLGVKLTLKPKDMKCLSTQIQELKVWDKGLEKNDLVKAGSQGSKQRRKMLGRREFTSTTKRKYLSGFHHVSAY